jgi:hypothetical protein
MSDGPRCGLYAIVKGFAIAAENAAAKLRLDVRLWRHFPAEGKN